MKKYKPCLIAVLVTLTLSLDYAQAQTFSAKVKRRAAQPNLPVLGSGTVRQLKKSTGFASSESVIGDSVISETKLGNIRIGATAPSSKLTIQGIIETTLGGLKFPNGTVQTSSANGPLFTVTHDTTLMGNGTAASPLGLAVPLNLIGATAISSGILNITNTAGGHGLVARGGNTSNNVGAVGVVGLGGLEGGIGVVGQRGDSNSGIGGNGVNAIGGTGSGAGHRGGLGIFAQGGFGLDGATDGLAGLFGGDVLVLEGGSFGGDVTVLEGGSFGGDVTVGRDVTIYGNLSKASGSFKIDHPLDPENKYLYHSFVESPDMMNIYNGNLTTDQNGDASVTLPDWFEALNRDFRYQLTVIGTFAQAIVASEVKENRFTIKTNAPNVKVSWQVTGIRKDAYANKNRIKVEVEKDERERGHYLHPEVFNQPEEKSIEWARHPEQKQRVKQLREQANQKQSQQQ